MNSDKCKKTEATLLARHIKKNGTYVLETHRCRCCKSYTHSCPRTGTNPRVFQTGSSSRACSTTSPTTEVERSKESVWTGRRMWPLTQQDSDLVIGVLVVQDRNKPRKTMSQGQLLVLLTGDMGPTRFCDYHQQTSCVRVFKHASNRYIDMKEWETWKALRKPAEKQSHAREFDLCVQSTLSVFAVKMDSAQDASSAAHLPQRVQWMVICQSIGALGDHLLRCNPPVGAVCDHLLLEPKKNW